MVTIINFESFPPKKLQLIETAQDLFSRHGVHRITIEEICKTANVSKMTFYKHFSNKWDVARAVLDYLINIGLTMYYDLIQEPIPFAQKVEKILMIATSRVHAIGSVFLDDLMEPDSPLHAYFMEQQKKVSELSIEFLQSAQKEGILHKNIQMPVALFMLTRLSELLNHPEFIQIMPDIEERAAEIATLFFQGFSRGTNTNSVSSHDVPVEQGQKNVTSSHS
jgi:AcrR family transcriptional regulator